MRLNNKNSSFFLKFIQLLYFMFIVLIFILAFGVSTQALLYPNQDLDWVLLGNVFIPSYFIMSGDDYSIRSNILSALRVGLSDSKRVNY
jgi:hypothetical protein